MIPISRPSVGEEELSEIRKVFASAWLGMGSLVFEFEKALQIFLQAKNVIAVNTGTSALHIALDALGLKKGDGILVPSLTYAATIQAVISCGAKPIFCDIQENTLNIDLEDLKRKIDVHVRVILPVHYGGLPCEMDEIMDIAFRHKITVVEDAAHAFGSTYKDKKIGSFGDITCFSFDPIKNITCGEGGAVVVRDDKLAQEIIKKRILGIDKDTWHRYKNERSWFYEVVTPGFRYHMSNINAAIGLVQLRKINRFLEKRRKVVKRYDEAFKDIKGIKLLYRDYEQTAPFNYIIRIKNNRRNDLLDFLNKNGIGAGVHYIPNHLQPLFKDYRTELPVTERVWKEIISLPLYNDISDEDVSTVIDKVKLFFK